MSLKNNFGEKIPFQPMPDDAPLKVMRMTDFCHLTSLCAHRNGFFMLLWTTSGIGAHRINCRQFDLLPGRLFFTHEGQLHQMISNPEVGWMIIFKNSFFQQYIKLYPEQEQSGLYDFFTRSPYVNLDACLSDRFNQVVSLMEKETQPNSRVLISYLSILLYHAAQLHTGTDTPVLNSFQAGQVRRLRTLINQHYKTQRKAPFYSSLMGISTRKLNEITSRAFGKLVQDMISDRLLSESEAMLGQTNLSMKEIIFELNFAGHAHFASFFKKAKGITPSAFRKQVKT